MICKCCGTKMKKISRRKQDGADLRRYHCPSCVAVMDTIEIPATQAAMEQAYKGLTRKRRTR
jgi:transcriptional regulator NrdR family protein